MLGSTEGSHVEDLEGVELRSSIVGCSDGLSDGKSNDVVEGEVD